MYDFSGNRDNELPPIRNLFGSLRVLGSVALWRTMTPGRRAEISNPLMFLFGDTWSRVQWEMNIGPAFCDDLDKYHKTDVYTMYVMPNEKYLLEYVDTITLNSCREYLKKERARRRENQKVLKELFTEEAEDKTEAEKEKTT